MLATPQDPTATECRTALLWDGRNQLVLIPYGFEMAGAEVLIRKERDTLILTPIRNNRLLDLLASWEPLEEGLTEVDDISPQIQVGR